LPLAVSILRVPEPIVPPIIRSLLMSARSIPEHRQLSASLHQLSQEKLNQDRSRQAGPPKARRCRSCGRYKGRYLKTNPPGDDARGVPVSSGGEQTPTVLGRRHAVWLHF